MPSSAASVKPSERASSAKARRSSVASSILSVMSSQPSRSPISGTPGPPQSDSSWLQMRLATSSECASSTRLTIAGSSSSGIDDSIVGGRPVITPSRADSSPAIMSSNGSMNLAMPSLSSFLVTSPMSMPASASSRSSSPGSWSAVAPSTSSCSAQASSVAIGIVFTVCGATRVATYLVSSYWGSFTPVDAHSGRCTGQPASRSFAKRSPSKSSLNFM